MPYPGSLVFWGSPQYRMLNLPFARQILLSQVVARHASPRGIRVPQSGWLHHHGEHDLHLGEAKSTYRRTHRWQRMHREDDSTTFACEDQIHKVLFSTQPDDIGLYGKPLARNAQVWSAHFHPVLHGPTADAAVLERAMTEVAHGHSLGYRFFYPPMQAGRFRNLLASPADRLPPWRQDAHAGYDADGLSHGGRCVGHVTARTRIVAALSTEPRNTKPLDRRRRTRRAAAAFAEQLGIPADQTFDAKDALTFHHTATRPFEVRYWKTIAKLAEGRYLNKNSADCFDRSRDAGAAAVAQTRSRSAGRFPARLLPQARARYGTTGARRRHAVPLENGFRISLDGRLAAIRTAARRSATSSASFPAAIARKRS